MSLDSEFGTYDLYPVFFFYTKEIINDILADEKKLHVKTLATMDVFEYVLE